MVDKEIGATAKEIEKSLASWAEGKSLIRRLQGRCQELQIRVHHLEDALRQARSEAAEKQKIVDDGLSKSSQIVELVRRLEAERHQVLEATRELHLKITNLEATIHELNLKDQSSRAELVRIAGERAAVQRKLDTTTQQLTLVSASFADFKDRSSKMIADLRMEIQEAQIRAQSQVANAEVSVLRAVKRHQQEKAELLQRIATLQERNHM
eukprot:c12330_g1_i1.p1 GENE.c12330_g1_i1~~c12330_g1_i1.p1  ORF type:complete len:210 (+),score=45.58 c12330_g1_i1:77-706(+)